MLDKYSMSCFYKNQLGVECPGCGMQRSMAELLRGNLAESLLLFPALIPIVFMITFLILHLIFNYRNGAAILKYSFIFTASVIVVHYVSKIIINGIG